jgi:predicted metal-binding membrane protein
MAEALTLERLLRRDRAVSAAGIVVLCLLAWVYVVAGAGLGMSAWRMTTVSLFPHKSMAAAPADTGGMDMPTEMMSTGAVAWDAAMWALIIAMWWVMMIAMMIPSVAPTILLYARVYRHAAAGEQIVRKVAPTSSFASGYILVWLIFSVVAAVLQWLLVRTDLLSYLMMGSQSPWLSGCVLIAAGLYQMSPWKSACLAHCRSPTEFLTRYWRPGAAGALRLGTLHGVYCVGCCWVLMALLFVGGVMNLVWIGVLAALVLAEKVLPGGPWLGRIVGMLSIAWGMATFVV